MSQEWKQAIEKSYNEEKDGTIERLHEVLQFPYHPDTQWILFLVEGYEGFYGIRPIPMKGSHSISIDSSNHPIYETKLQDLEFSFSSVRYFDPNELDDDEIEEFDEYAEKYLYEWFSDRFLEAGGDSFPVPCYLQFHDGGKRFNMKTKQWVEE
ncbi:MULTISPECIES: hypothetical protein [Thermoactinomyces]|uniref:Uncharacterized protein n=1 Tax=Thermoactinomyces daqus TaxID=1329516 RepID=A0A7W2AJM4_9BACL|nr:MULTISPECIES: hypothetical protein [Thermoactinomyces]MBA4544575.1 hypothetical protein [Thermoactinomyces daqus]MBH8599735.1 hypothetical protein [Thermoactinomyces sp. CICC 10523]MBH8605939.1 hypothetical protein [Thermoactinomyces sp. CICC 10522]MBH8609444.1 hypothetical protein [Thermoactinomyces sp. CICC 10521]